MKQFAALVIGAWMSISGYAHADVLSTGEFVTVTPGDDVMGQVTIKTTEAGTQLVLEDDFESKKGPDLFVVLHKKINPKSYGPDEALILAPLMKLAGKQVYSVPEEVDVTQYKTVLIWCKEFNVLFGKAVLKAAGEKSHAVATNNSLVEGNLR